MVYSCTNNILSLLYPPHCVICNAPGFENLDLCRDCLDELPFNTHCCALCALPMETESSSRVCGSCQTSPPAFDHCVSPLRFEHPVSQLVNGFKFHSKLAYGRLLAILLGNHLERHAVEPPELIIPVPLHRRRLAERGYNQALELAKPLGRRFQTRVEAGLCQRTRPTPAQSGLDRKHRRRNLRGAFELKRPVDAQHIALVDDVVTTGSTVSEIAGLLKKAGVARVDVWSLARTAID